MASIIIDGLVVPVSVGGDPALDFCNTRAGWGLPAPKEYLVSYDHLAVWAGTVGLITATEVTRVRHAAANATHRDTAAALLARAIALREALYPVLLRRAGPRDWATINTEAHAAAGTARLTPATDCGPATWAPAGPGLSAPLAAVAWAAAALLTSPAAAMVAACPGDGCGWVFHDARGRRRWCTMAICGNRAKVRAHARRSKAHPAPPVTG